VVKLGILEVKHAIDAILGLGRHAAQYAARCRPSLRIASRLARPRA
jgi:hypothetical protein